MLQKERVDAMREELGVPTCFSGNGTGHWARNCPQATITGTLHEPHMQSQISQMGGTTILTGNTGWSFDLRPLQTCADNAEGTTRNCSSVVPRARGMPCTQCACNVHAVQTFVCRQLFEPQF